MLVKGNLSVKLQVGTQVPMLSHSTVLHGRSCASSKWFLSSSTVTFSYSCSTYLPAHSHSWVLFSRVARLQPECFTILPWCQAEARLHMQNLIMLGPLPILLICRNVAHCENNLIKSITYQQCLGNPLISVCIDFSSAPYTQAQVSLTIVNEKCSNGNEVLGDVGFQSCRWTLFNS